MARGRITRGVIQLVTSNFRQKENTYNDTGYQCNTYSTSYEPVLCVLSYPVALKAYQIGGCHTGNSIYKREVTNTTSSMKLYTPRQCTIPVFFATWDSRAKSILPPRVIYPSLCVAILSPSLPAPRIIMEVQV